jgi:archaellum component FlaC
MHLLSKALVLAAVAQAAPASLSASDTLAALQLYNALQPGSVPALPASLSNLDLDSVRAVAAKISVPSELSGLLAKLKPSTGDSTDTQTTVSADDSDVSNTALLTRDVASQADLPVIGADLQKLLADLKSEIHFPNIDIAEVKLFLQQIAHKLKDLDPLAPAVAKIKSLIEEVKAKIAAFPKIDPAVIEELVSEIEAQLKALPNPLAPVVADIKSLVDKVKAKIAAFPKIDPAVVKQLLSEFEAQLKALNPLTPIAKALKPLVDKLKTELKQFPVMEATKVQGLLAKIQAKLATITGATPPILPSSVVVPFANSTSSLGSVSQE